MIYKDFQKEKLSALGFGTMRLPTFGAGWDAPVNEPEAARLIAYAYEWGVNYFDTAYPYHGGESERILGRALRQFPRESFNLATKFPGLERRPGFDPSAIFEEQLQKCGVDYFDFYLLHNINENSMAFFLDPAMGVVDYLREQKARGRIRHFGFSAHARPDTLRRFLDLHGDKMAFGQLQLNYLDWTLQGAKAKYELLTERGIPVWVMEPVRGGRLAALSPEAEAKLKNARPGESIPAWAFRWLQGLPNVTMVLSGMSAMDQVEDNLKTFSEGKPLTPSETKLLEEIAASMLDLLPCTACRYCVPACPQRLDIPILLGYYNECRFEPSFSAVMGVEAMAPEARPSACLACGSCKKACPQNIDIPEALKAFQATLDKMPPFPPRPPERPGKKD